jgi:hypothetical protein
LSGGDPERMTLRRFIDVGFAILVEEYQRLGVDLLSAIDKVSALGGADVPEPERIDNKQSINDLMAMMGGVKGAPV